MPTNRKPRGPRIFATRNLIGVGAAAACLLTTAWLGVRLAPLPQALVAPQAPPLEFLDHHGQSLRALPDEDELFRNRVAYQEIPQGLIHATLAAEDRRFWQHPGVDWRGTCRAAWQMVRNRRIISGGSTITQQLIKLAEPRPRTFRSKCVEALQALRLEQLWTKQQILAAYLNRIEYGNGVAGCALAARFYFAKPLRDLSPAESALLAGLPQAPTRLNPHRHFEGARKRQLWILGQLRGLQWLDETAYERATREPLVLAAPRRAFEAPHFVDLLLRQPGLPVSGALRTSLDLQLNRHAQRLLRAHLAQLRGHQASNGAVVVIDNRSGEVLSLVGSEDYFGPQAGQVNGAWAPRSPGSALKPFTYLLAFERGATPASVLADVATEFATPTGLFAPVNFDHHWYGPVSCRMALANSLNMPAVKALAQFGGPEALVERLRAWGLTTLNQPPAHYGLGLTIGNAEVRLLELANAYACLARLGDFKPPRLTLDTAAAPTTRITNPNAAYLIADILSDNHARVTAFGADSDLRFPFKVACKTGTSSNFRDNWAFGYTPEFTVGVWVGNFDSTPMRQISGVTGAAPILHDIFMHLHRQHGTSWYERPSGICEAWVHPLTGRRLRQIALAPDSEKVRELFAPDHLPPYESPDDYDAAGRVILPPEYRVWAATGNNYLTDRAVVKETAGALRILFPLPGTVIHLDPDLPYQGGRIHLRAEAPPQARWSSPSIQCRREADDFTAVLVEGRHDLVLQDPVSGEELTTWVQVLAR